jgi:hypothetical protein
MKVRLFSNYEKPFGIEMSSYQSEFCDFVQLTR